MSRSTATCLGMLTKATFGTSSGRSGARTGQLTSPIVIVPPEASLGAAAPGAAAAAAGPRSGSECRCRSGSPAPWRRPAAACARSAATSLPTAAESRRSASSREAGGRNLRHAERARVSAPSTSPGRRLMCATMRRSSRRLSCRGASATSSVAALRIWSPNPKMAFVASWLRQPWPTKASCSSLGSGATKWKWKSAATSSSIQASVDELPLPGGSPQAMQRKEG
mmetsp:Transcript_10524/g.32739  ORF Transcript_10524/g.32739 Transcript_10524/m.32739 type:complete len:224 (-) Transcript_10524:1923-2594(-)